MDYVLLICSALILAVDFALNKAYQKIKGTSAAAGFGFNSLLGLFTAILFFIINGFKMSFSLYSFIMAILVNAFIMSYNIIGFKLLRSGTMASYTLFLMSGGMTVPYIFGLLFLSETFSVLRTVALLLILFGIALTSTGDLKVNSKQTLLCIAVFFINGFVSVFSKLHQIEAHFDTINIYEFVAIGGIFKFALAGILCLLSRKGGREERQKKSAFVPLVIIFLSSIASGSSYLMMLLGAVNLPASVLYPFVTGGTIVASSLMGVLVFKEKLSKKLVLSVVLCVIGTILFL